MIPDPYTFSLDKPYFPHSNKRPFEKMKEMSIDRRLANIAGPLVWGSYCPSSQNQIKKALHEITVVKAILILFLLSFDS